MNKARAHKHVHKIATGVVTSLAVICVVGLATWAWKGISGSAPGPSIQYCLRKSDAIKLSASIPLVRHNDVAEEEHEVEVRNVGKAPAAAVAVRISTDYPMVSLGATGDVERKRASGRVEPVEQKLTPLDEKGKVLEVSIPKLMPEQTATVRFVVRRSVDEKSTWPRVEVVTEAGAGRRVVIRRQGWTSLPE